MGANHEIIILDDQVANGRRGHVVAQRVPVLALIERDVDGLFRTGKQQAAPFGVLAHDVDDAAVGDAAGDVGPRLAPSRVR